MRRKIFPVESWKKEVGRKTKFFNSARQPPFLPFLGLFTAKTPHLKPFVWRFVKPKAHRSPFPPPPFMQTLRVSAKSKPNTVAGAIAGVIREEGQVEVQTVGAAALNQAVKAIAIARGFLISSGTDLVCAPSFSDIEIDGNERTAIRLLVMPKK